MSKAIVGRKLGMSQIFAPDGTVIPVSVVEATPCSIVQVKTKEKDGYAAVKVAYGKQVSLKILSKPVAGQFKNAGVTAYAKRFKEFRFANASEYKTGDSITCSVFQKGDKVDVTGKTKGHGFSGTIKRWNTHCGPKAHGSGYHRGVGSLGANSTPSRVFKNKKMPGQYGNEQVTIQNLEIVKVDESRNLLFVSGGIPGADGGTVTIKQTVKKVTKSSRWYKEPKATTATGKK
ncbi:MAG: 50S ribosomal protein L3 [Christensenellaceae bacterium]|jgi:large subunit ribosomal protein L3|nr:50S ribosomal protein L3 [Christensenellaceae bacterium]